MASLIKIKRSEVAGNPAVLGTGELAYSALADNGANGGDRLYIGMGTETEGNAVNHVVIGGKYFTDQITAATATNTALTIVRRDVSGNFAAGTITAALTGNATTATAWATARDLSLTGDATATLVGVKGDAAVSAVLTLKEVFVSPGTYGSATQIPIVTVNNKGLVTAVALAASSTSLMIAGGTGTDILALGTDTLTFAGSTGVTTTVTNNQVSFAIGQAVGITDNVTFNNVTVNGTLTSDDITSTNINVTGNAVITGNLTVQGTTTTINSTAVAITDVNLTLAKDAVTATAANGAGLTVAGPTVPATFTYTSINDSWNLNKDLVVTNVYGSKMSLGTANSDNVLEVGGALVTSGVSNISFGRNSYGFMQYNSNFTKGLSIQSFGTTNAERGTFAIYQRAGDLGLGINTPMFVTAAGQIILGSSNAFDPTTTSTATVVINSRTHVSDSTASTSTTTGALVVTGGVGISGALNVSGTGIGYSGSTSGSTTLKASAVAGTNVITLPVVTGTVITSGDTGTVTNTMLAGSIENAKLVNSSITVGSTAIALGGTSTVLVGLTSVTSTSFVGALTGNASTATALATARTIAITGDLTYTSPLFDGSGNVTAAGTLATVNSNIGSFGNGTTVPNFTVNAKGLITAAGSTAIPTATTDVLGLAKFQTTEFTVTAGLVTIKAVDGGTY
jgi:hypothetical protein